MLKVKPDIKLELSKVETIIRHTFCEGKIVLLTSDLLNHEQKYDGEKDIVSYFLEAFDFIRKIFISKVSIEKQETRWFCFKSV